MRTGAVLAAGIVFFGISVLAGCGTLGGTDQVGSRLGGLAQFPPQIDGTITSIQPGNPSYVLLKDVTIMDKKGPGVHKSELKLKLPAGKFVSHDHWQSTGDTLDLFIGDDLTELTDSGHMIDNAPAQGFAGIVKSVTPTAMVVQKVLYDEQATHDSRSMKPTNETVTLQLAPYTRVLVDGGGDPQPVSKIQPGNAVLFVLIGPPSEYIATQITVFQNPSAAGWKMD